MGSLRTAIKQVSHHSQRMGGINAVALSQDETTVLTMGQEKRMTYWDLREHHPVLAKARYGNKCCGYIARILRKNSNIVDTG